MLDDEEGGSAGLGDGKVRLLAQLLCASAAHHCARGTGLASPSPAEPQGGPASPAKRSPPKKATRGGVVGGGGSGSGGGGSSSAAVAHAEALSSNLLKHLPALLERFQAEGPSLLRLVPLVSPSALQQTLVTHRVHLVSGARNERVVLDECYSPSNAQV